MIHSGSRNLGHRIATFHHKKALELNEKWHSNIPNKECAFFSADSMEGETYLKDMNFALEYARENRQRMLTQIKEAILEIRPRTTFEQEINIHHNYAVLENHFGKNVWVHRKGAIRARKGELGIIPGSMGTPSYIVKGLGNPESFMSCSHGAGRKMGRMQATKTLTKEECDKAMRGVVFGRWSLVDKRVRKKLGKKALDLSEAPGAYKDIEDVIENELDLIKPMVKLRPIGVIKG